MVVKRGGRVPRSVRVSKELWLLFKKAVNEKGFSTCFILETLMEAYVAGATAVTGVIKSNSIEIHQKIEYVVDRPRRKRRFTHPLENCFVIPGHYWKYRKPLSGEELSKQGHVPECKCNVCVPYVSPRDRELSRKASREPLTF